MTRSRLTIFAVVCSLLIGTIPLSVHGVTPLSPADNLSAETNRQLAQARRGTAKYHDVSAAEEDGYVNIHIYESGEGLHYVNFSLIDGTFDPSHPEVLLYAPAPNENRLVLVAVEYVVPLNASATAPEGFAGSNDAWRENSEGLGLWELDAWIWMNNSDGIFAFKNSRVP